MSYTCYKSNLTLSLNCNLYYLGFFSSVYKSTCDVLSVQTYKLIQYIFCAYEFLNLDLNCTKLKLLYWYSCTLSFYQIRKITNMFSFTVHILLEVNISNFVVHYGENIFCVKVSFDLHLIGVL